MSRAQVLACGEEPHDIRRRLRRREWATVVDGVYVNHTGELNPDQRAMAGVLVAASGLDEDARPVGAALGGHAALRHAVGPSWKRGSGQPIAICIDVRRSVGPQAGYRFVRVNRLAERVDRMRTPPRLRPAEAALDLALDGEDLLEAVQIIADACQSRCTSAGDIGAALARRPRARAGQSWPLCWPTSRPEPVRRWSTSSSSTSYVVIGCRCQLDRSPGSCRRSVAADASTAMPSGRSSGPWSSSTAACFTTTPASETATSTATSTTWSRGRSRCGWAGDR